MIKYFCDICGEEIPKDEYKKMTIKCSVISNSDGGFSLAVHDFCAIHFIGEERIAEIQKKHDEYSRKLKKQHDAVRQMTIAG